MFLYAQDPKKPRETVDETIINNANTATPTIVLQFGLHGLQVDQQHLHGSSRVVGQRQRSQLV